MGGIVREMILYIKLDCKYGIIQYTQRFYTHTVYLLTWMQLHDYMRIRWIVVNLHIYIYIFTYLHIYISLHIYIYIVALADFVSDWTWMPHFHISSLSCQGYAGSESVVRCHFYRFAPASIPVWFRYISNCISESWTGDFQKWSATSWAVTQLLQFGPGFVFDL